MGEYPYVSKRGNGLFNYDWRDSTDPSPKNSKRLGSGTTDPLPHASNGSYRFFIGINAQTNDNLGSAGATGGADPYPIYLTDFPRTPSAPSAGPTLGTRTNGGTQLTIVSAVSPPLNPVGPTITQYQYQVRSSADGVTYGSWSTTPVPMATPPGGTNVTGLSPTTFYQFQTRAVNSEGEGAWSATATSNVAPAFPNVDASGNITTLPDTATFGVPYSGTVYATNATSISVGGGSLPPGLTTSLSTPSEGNRTLTISGSPTAPGLFSFYFTASGAGGTTNSSTQTLSVGAAGPWVKTEAVNYTSATATIAAYNSTYRLATLVLPAHGIRERNQPITVAGLTGAFSGLNGFWSVLSYTPGTAGLSYADATISFLVPTQTLASQAIAIGTVTVDYTRGVIRRYTGSAWVTGPFMRTYDPTYIDGAGSRWKPLS
ncbi:Fibronectin type III [uncultured Caudovirales phage]|uniref:Fibronectin type III n=1 Tax=uncultured Caudovirales phage TaxID=2100421 RepID=A0A6J5L3E1_9CAUD|nr:Fibronectin type III [uncultured Caudovirales phage]